MSDLDLIYSTKPKPIPAPSPAKSTPQKIKKPPQSTSQSTGQSISQSKSQPPNQRTHKIVDRPKAFYITEGLDEKLDQAVAYLQRKHGIKKVDRSTVVNALLDHDTLWTEDALDQLVESVISQLTSRLTGR
jgi:hypothetical protein